MAIAHAIYLPSVMIAIVDLGNTVVTGPERLSIMVLALNSHRDLVEENLC